MKFPSRLDVFLSSSQKEFEDIRISLEEEISDLPFLNCRLLERRGAKPVNTLHASLQASLNCDIYIGLFGRIYSDATIKEYKEADKNFKPILAYVKMLKKRDAKLQKFIDTEVSNNYKYETFTTKRELISSVKRDLMQYIFDTLKDGQKAQAERKQKALKRERKKTALTSTLETKSEELELMLIRAEIQFEDELYMDSIITNAHLIEMSLRRKLKPSYPNIEQKSAGDIIEYAKDAKILSDDVIQDVREVQHIRNTITHRGIAPTGEAAKLALSTAKNVISQLSKAKIGTIKWVAYYAIELEEKALTRKHIEELDRLTDELYKYLRSKVGEFDVTETLDEKDYYNLRISFNWDISKAPIPIGNVGGWEMREVDPYVDIYGPAED